MEEEYFPFEYITFHLVPCLAKYISLFCITNSFRFLFFYFFLSCIMVCILLTIKKHWLSSFEISGRREILVWTTDRFSVEALYHPYQPWCLHISISIVPTFYASWRKISMSWTYSLFSLYDEVKAREKK